MPLSELKTRLKNTVRSFERKYETHVFFYPEDKIPSSIIQVTMTDHYHFMILYIQIEMATTKIIDIDAEETRVPYESCPNAINSYTKLIGMQLSKLVRAKESIIEKRLSCLHLNELLEEGFRSYTAAYGFYLKDQYYPLEYHEDKMFYGDLSREKRRHITQHWWMKDRRVKNSCYSFSEERKQTELAEIVETIPSFTDMVLKELKKSSNP
ncbi:MAG: DUF2889 domain-containing protein [Leptospiraceae bacterium]|nr:DUF2889 domain-containing protein [Leptospiraceae bacterium]